MPDEQGAAAPIFTRHGARLDLGLPNYQLWQDVLVDDLADLQWATLGRAHGNDDTPNSQFSGTEYGVNKALAMQTFAQRWLRDAGEDSALPRTLLHNVLIAGVHTPARLFGNRISWLTTWIR